MTNQEFLSKHIVERKGTNCMKWDDLTSLYGKEDLLPMWIADTEFSTCDAIVNALHTRVSHGAFGYSVLPKDYISAFSGWMDRHYGLTIEKEWLRLSAGCVGAIALLVNAITEPGDACVIMTPVYYPFHNVGKENGRKLVTCELIYEDGTFHIDYEAFEKAIVENDAKLFIQCSPHNPVGRVWTEDELKKVLSICRKHGVLVISDEIHQDIALWGNRFIPAFSVAEGAYRDIVIVVTSVSKTFNLPGLMHSHVLIPNAELRAKYDALTQRLHCFNTNVLGQVAARAGYLYGDEWHKAFISVIESNYNYMKDTIAARAPEITVCKLEGTFLPLLDLSKVVDPKRMHSFMVDQGGMAVDYGEQFGAGYEGFIRLNIATDPKILADAVERILKAIGK